MKQLEFSLTTTPNYADFDTLILPVFSDGTSLTQADELGLTATLKELNEAKDFTGKGAATFTLLNTANFKRIILSAMGDKDKVTPRSYLKSLEAQATALNTTGANKVLNLSSEVQVAYKDMVWKTYHLANAHQQSQYDYTHPSRGKFEAKENSLAQVTLLTEDSAENTQAVNQAQQTALGMNLTKTLANMPANFCTPTHLAETAQELGKTHGLKVTILEKEEMLKMGMGSFMAVAQGSTQAPKMIAIEYKGAGDEAPIALVGKGVTFDTGGISLKPGAAMDEMKYDMGGAASVLGTMQAIAELKPKINLVGVIPTTENMPAGNALKPGDVVTSLDGQTIEILNTDAEGRLILCDALTYAQQTFKPCKIIDIATLTGAVIIGLGSKISGLMGNNQELMDELLEAGKTTNDEMWQLPQNEDYDEQLKSNFADMANIGGREAGTITAAQFLGRFTKDTAWAHLDIAGTAWQSGANKGASGRPVPALVEFVMQQAK